MIHSKNDQWFRIRKTYLGEVYAARRASIYSNFRNTGNPRRFLATPLACVACVSVRLSARSRHFSLFGRAKIGASAFPPCRFHFSPLAPIFVRPKSEIYVSNGREKPTETLATQATTPPNKGMLVQLSQSYINVLRGLTNGSPATVCTSEWGVPL